MDESIRGVGIRSIVDDRVHAGFGERYPARHAATLGPQNRNGWIAEHLDLFLLDGDSCSATGVPCAEREVDGSKVVSERKNFELKSLKPDGIQAKGSFFPTPG